MFLVDFRSLNRSFITPLKTKTTDDIERKNTKPPYHKQFVGFLKKIRLAKNAFFFI